MSNLLKSKFFLGALVVAVMLGSFVAVKADKAEAATCSITVTLRVGSKGDQVKCLQSALDHGLVADGSFGPKTKAEVVAWQASVGLVADGIFGAKSRAAWTGGSVTVTYPAGCTSSVGYSSTTGQLCTGTVVNTFPAGCTSSVGFSSTTGASCATGAVNNQTGPVTASLASDNPASAYIVGNQATADLAHFTFTGTGTLASVTLQRTGVSDQNTLSNVYLYNGNTRLTDGFSFNNVGQLTMNNLGIAINGSKTISVKADVASVLNASSLGVALISFTASGNTPTVVNIRGNDMTYGFGNLASVSLKAQTLVSCGAGCPAVNAGTSAYTVWSAPLQVNTRAVVLKGANFRMTGSAPADALGNIHLFIDGVSTGAAATLTSITGSNYATFDFSANPVNLSTGTHTVDVRADIVKGSSYTVTVSLQQASDLVIFDPQVGVNIAALNPAGNTFTTNSAPTITINAGTASVVVDPTFQSQTNITGGATNAVIAKFKIHGYGEDVKVQSLTVTPSLTNACTSGATYGTAPCNVTAGASATQFATGNGLNNVTLFFNGSQVGSSVNWLSGAILFNLGSQMILPAGTDSSIEVHADLSTYVTSASAVPTSANGANYTAGQLNAGLTFVAGNAQGQSSHNTIDFPASNSGTTTLTIQTGTLAVSKNTGYQSQSVGPNTANVKIGSYTLQNQSTSESVRVTALNVSLFDNTGAAMTSLTTPALTNFSNLRTSETSGSGANPVQPSGSNTFSVDFTLAPSAQKTIDIFADTSAAVGTSFSTKLVVTSIGASSNVNISQNANGTAVQGQVMTLATGTITNNIALLTAPSTSQQFVPAANGGATNATKATFKINATGGSATISEMKFTVNGQDFSTTYTGTTTAGAVQTLTVAEKKGFAIGDTVQLVGATSNGVGTVVTASGSGAGTITVWVNVAPVGASTVIRLVPATVTGVSVNGISASPVNGIAYLTGLNLVVPNGGSGLSQDVYVSYSEVGTNGVQSASTARIALEYVKYQSGNVTTTLFSTNLGCSSGCMTPASAPTMKLEGSVPSLAVLSSGSVLVPGTVEVGDIKVTASAKGSIVLKALPLNVTMSSAQLTAAGCQANGIIVKDANNNPVTTTNTAFLGSADSACTTSTPQTHGLAGGTTTISFGSTGYQIDTTQTFKIYLQVDATNFNGSTPVAHAATVSTGLGLAYTSDTQGFVWTDIAGNASALTGTDVVAGTTITGGFTAVGNETTISNSRTDRTNGPGFFYSYPTTTVSVSS